MYPSPNPIYLTGILTSSLIAKTIPPLALPSSLVKTIPVISVISLKFLACDIPFWPVVASNTNKVSWGADGIICLITLFILKKVLIPQV